MTYAEHGKISSRPQKNGTDFIELIQASQTAMTPQEAAERILELARRVRVQPQPK